MNNSYRSVIIFFVLFAGVCCGREYYVSTEGSDGGSGSRAGPFGTIQKAVDVMVAGDTCYIRQGRYTESVAIKELKGSADKPIVFMPYNGEKVVLDGSDELKVKWTKHRGSIYKAKLDEATLKEQVREREVAIDKAIADC